MQKIAPDIDFLLITDKLSGRDFYDITASLEEQGFIPSDYDIGASMTQIVAACQNPDEIAFPIDLHVVSADDFTQWAQEFDVDNSDTWKLNMESWYGTQILQEANYFGLGSIGTIYWLMQSEEVASLMRGNIKRILKSLNIEGSTEQSRTQLLFQKIRKGSPVLDRIAMQPYMEERILSRLAENMHIE